eukprot:scaffold4867_cov107-Amphora_coffeaeformis.AAC.1
MDDENGAPCRVCVFSLTRTKIFRFRHDIDVNAEPRDPSKTTPSKNEYQAPTNAATYRYRHTNATFQHSEEESSHSVRVE